MALPYTQIGLSYPFARGSPATIVEDAVPQEPPIAARIECHCLLHALLQRIRFRSLGHKVDNPAHALGEHAGAGIDHHQSSQAVAVVDCVMEGVESTHRMADEDELAQAQVIDESFNIGTM